ncbi:glycoside hydrolase superfamily [Gongronella butleri]|nr:glycoside hydrolase superfamily [Gongronella butleri]
MVKLLFSLLAAPVLLLLASAAPLHTCKEVSDADVANDAFVKTSGAKFILNGKNFYFAGTNAFYMMVRPQTDIQSLVTQCKSLKLPVVRTWLFNLGDDRDVWFQKWDASKKVMTINDDDQTGLGRMDYILQQAAKNDIKLIFTLTNNWQDYGGMDYYVTKMGAKYHDDFYINADIKAAYKDYVKHVLNRVSKMTNVAYKDDPTIFGWELANEPRCSGIGGLPTVLGNVPTSSNCNAKMTTAWISEMSAYVKSIDVNHLVGVGDEGFFNRKGNDPFYNGSYAMNFDAIMALDTIDYGTAHLYLWNDVVTESWISQWIKDHASAASLAKKPAIFEEYGVYPDSERVKRYPTWQKTIEDSNLAGSNF